MTGRCFQEVMKERVCDLVEEVTGEGLSCGGGGGGRAANSYLAFFCVSYSLLPECTDRNCSVFPTKMDSAL